MPLHSGQLLLDFLSLENDQVLLQSYYFLFEGETM